MFSSIKLKLILIIGTGSIIALTCVFFAIFYFYNKNIDLIIKNSLHQSEHLINEQVRLDTQKMGGVLDVILQDQVILGLFAKRDLDALYKKTEPLFSKLRSKYGITHFYFHLPDGINFLRVHKRAMRLDRIDRHTFREAVRTGNVSSGLELGKTSFALRIVAPCYLDGRLIGYVELGHEIDHFIDFLKAVTGDDFALVVEKKQIDRAELEAANKSQGHMTKWDQMESYVCISRPKGELAAPEFMDQQLIESFIRKAGYADLSPFPVRDKVFGGFPFLDAEGQAVGCIVTLVDISSQSRVIGTIKHYSIYAVSFLFLITFAAILFFSGKVITRPIREISRAAQIFAGGELRKHRIEVGSRDEIGMLAEAINEMAMQLDEHYTTAVERTHELERLNKALEELAITDGLTSLYNHRYFYLKLSEELKRARRYSRPLSLIIADIDFFKKFNDSHGHVSGDAMLKDVALLLQKHARENDLAARYGGEEFGIILPETALEEAVSIAERMRTLVEDACFLHEDGGIGGRLTLSFGVAELTDQVKEAREFVAMADAALYRAKGSGRNRVESCRIFPSLPSSEA